MVDFTNATIDHLLAEEEDDSVLAKDDQMSGHP